MCGKYNTGETHEELRALYNPDGSVLREAQCRMIDMLKYIDDVCRKIGVTYMLDGGNVLGYVRHNGEFIPWDDDVDIVLERKEYEKLNDYLHTHPHPQYVIQSPKTDPYYFQEWNVLRDLKSEYIQDKRIHNVRKYKGLQIDIFPIETNVIPFLQKIDNFILRQNNRFVIGRNKYMAKYIFYFVHNVLNPVFRFLGRFIGEKHTYSYSYGLPWKTRLDNNILYPNSEVIFEGIKVMAPAKIHEYLSITYGDYMTLPPKDKRDHHRAQYKIWGTNGFLK